MPQQDHEGRLGRSPKESFVTVYGRMPVLEVLQNPDLNVDKIMVAHSAHGESLSRIMDLARSRGVPVQRATAQRIKLLAGNGKHDQGIIADVVAPEMRSLAEFAEDSRRTRKGYVLVLDGVNNPANVGMIIRAATGAGMSGIVLPRVGSPGIDPIVIKASAGVAYRATIVWARTPQESIQVLKGAGFKVYGLHSEAPSDLFEHDFSTKSAFVVGNETDGLSTTVSELIDEWISIPLQGGVESLNVATAAAVLCFDLVRRGRNPAGGAGLGPLGSAEPASRDQRGTSNPATLRNATRAAAKRRQSRSR